MKLYAENSLEFPGDVTLVTLVNDKLHNGFTGVYHDPSVLGALAVDLVAGMLHRAEIGLPKKAHYVLVSGEWVEGRPVDSPPSAEPLMAAT